MSNLKIIEELKEKYKAKGTDQDTFCLHIKNGKNV